MSIFEQAKEAAKKRGKKAIGVVTNSVELQRILALPRRCLDLRYEPEGELIDCTDHFAKPSSQIRLWPIQSAALIEAALADGLFAPISVGRGKTLICLLLPEALDAKRAVLLVKPQLRNQLLEETEGFYGRHFDLPLDRLTVVAYSELSSQSGAGVLEKIKPDLVIADEANYLRHRSAARTKRFYRYMREHPECRFCALSGTMTNRSILDYADLIELALRKNSPLPVGYHERRDWAGALDVNPEQIVQPGKLMLFCRDSETPRDGFRRRLTETQGVVATDEDELGTSLIIKRIRFDYPLETEYDKAASEWEYDGQLFVEAFERSRFLRQMSLGFYYKWDWPTEKDQEWLDARKAWHQAVRKKLRHARPGLDSPGLLEQAAQRGDWKCEAYDKWLAVKSRPKPPTVSVWLNYFAHNHVFAWIRDVDEEKRRGIIWYEFTAVGEYLAEWCGVPLYGPDRDPRKATEPIILASLHAHGDGKNLQAFSRQLWTSMPPNGTIIEQGIGRSHRPGQKDDTVEVSWFGHTDASLEAWGQVLADAEYVQATTGHRQKVLYATKLL